jgi:hypothetical protein
MGAEADALCGVPYGERSPERVNRRRPASFTKVLFTMFLSSAAGRGAQQARRRLMSKSGAGAASRSGPIDRLECFPALAQVVFSDELVQLAIDLRLLIDEVTLLFG